MNAKCVLSLATLAKTGSSNRLAPVRICLLTPTEGHPHLPQDVTVHHLHRHLRAALTVTAIELQTVDHHFPLPQHRNLCQFCHQHRIHLVTRIDQIPRVPTVVPSLPTLSLAPTHLKY